MKIRVFVPGDESEANYSGQDHHFPSLPKLGDTIRFAAPQPGDFIVTRVGFIQEGEAFIGAVWTRREQLSGYEQRGLHAV